MNPNTKYIIIAIVVVVIAYLGYDLLKPYMYPCDSLFQQTATQIGGDIETIKAKGDLFVGAQQIQELTERSQIVALNLKACCTLTNRKILTPEQFLVCKSNAEQYQKRISDIAAAVKQAEVAKKQGNERVVTQKIQHMNALINLSQNDAKAIKRQLKPRTGAAINIPKSFLKKSLNNSLNESLHEKEPNNSFLEAQDISMDRTMLGNIASSGDHDYYMVSYKGGQKGKIKIKVENLSVVLRPVLTIYDQNKTRIRSTHKSTPGADLSEYIIMEPERGYFIRVAGYAGSKGKYRLHITGSGSDE